MKTLEKVIKENEWLTYPGWRDNGNGKDELINASAEFITAAEWVGRYMRPQKEIDRFHSSYGIKHCCERKTGRYISNGVMIAAFLAHGYIVERINKTLNAWFNASKCAIDFAYSEMNSDVNGYVYFIRQSKDCFKIGMTKGAPIDRLNQLQTSSPVPLSMYKYVGTTDPKYLEKLLHQEFAPYRLSGEWFEITSEMIDDVFNRI